MSPRPPAPGTLGKPARPAAPLIDSHALDQFPVLASPDKPAAMAKVIAELKACNACGLCGGAKNYVPGEGDLDAKIMFIGEGPGEQEDLKGRPFVGRAGELLDKQIAAMGLQREQVYIANIVKCRPPGNRAPTPEEAVACSKHLLKQIGIIRPAAIVALGATATKLLLGDPKLAITKIRGTWQAFCGIPVMPTFHPAFLLRSYTPDNRRKVWDDLQKVMEKVGIAK